MSEFHEEKSGRSQARSELGQAASEAKAGAREAARAGKERARSFLDEQKDTAAHRVSGMAEALKATAQDLERRPDAASGSAGFARQAAESMERFATTLQERDVNSLLGEATRLARRRPAAFIAGAVTAGFLLARFLKSSGERDHETHGNGGTTFAAGERTPSTSVPTGGRPAGVATPGSTPGTTPRRF